MPAFWAALIAAAAAILSSALTSFLTHRLERKRRRMQYELEWLEDRFTPGLNFLGRVVAIVSSIPNTQEERRRMADEIRKIVIGSLKENNAWCVGVLLDPEETGLDNLVHSAMTYARIAESEKEFTQYWIRVQSSLKALAEEFRKERQAIVSGKSLESLIKQRKAELDERTARMAAAVGALRGILGAETSIASALKELRGSGVRGARLEWAFDLLSNSGSGDEEGQARLEELRQACEERGWFAM